MRCSTKMFVCQNNPKRMFNKFAFYLTEFDSSYKNVGTFHTDLQSALFIWPHLQEACLFFFLRSFSLHYTTALGLSVFSKLWLKLKALQKNVSSAHLTTALDIWSKTNHYIEYVSLNPEQKSGWVPSVTWKMWNFFLDWQPNLPCEQTLAQWSYRRFSCGEHVEDFDLNKKHF